MTRVAVLALLLRGWEHSYCFSSWKLKLLVKAPLQPVILTRAPKSLQTCTRTPMRTANSLGRNFG